MTTKQRAALRAMANTMQPILHIGKDGINDNMVKQAWDALEARELIKVKVLKNSMYSAKEAAPILAEKTGSECVQVIGSKFVLYKQKDKESQYAGLLK